MSQISKNPLAEWMSDTGVSQLELARRAKTHQPLISAYLGGRRELSKQVAKRISETTGIPIESLLFGVTTRARRARS
jgi:transcriptional regulator with XRE-family HTH domain